MCHCRPEKESCVFDVAHLVCDGEIPEGLSWDAMEYSHESPDNDPHGRQDEQALNRQTDRACLEEPPIETEDGVLGEDKRKGVQQLGVESVDERASDGFFRADAESIELLTEPTSESPYESVKSSQ